MLQLVQKDIIIVVVDLASDDCMKHLNNLVDSLSKLEKSFNKIIIIGNKKNA